MTNEPLPEIGDSYTTRAGLLVVIHAHMPDDQFIACFHIRGTRIRILYDHDGREVNGEKGLDIMKRTLRVDAYGPLVKGT